MSRSLSIALALPDLHGGGAERLSIILARRFVELGHRVSFVLLRDEGSLLEEARAAGTVLGLGARRVRDAPVRLASAVRRLRADVLVANIWPLTVAASLALRSIAASARPRLVLVEHNPLSLQYAHAGPVTQVALRASLAAACRLADRRVGVSSGVARDSARLAGMPDHRFDVVHNPIELAAVDARELAAAEATWGAPRGRRILNVGSFKPQKNHVLLLQAFDRMRLPGDKLMILGDGALADAIRAEARRLRLDDALVLPGFVAQPAPFFRSADLFALSSDYEGFGNVLVEALAAGLPVVSTDCPSGPAEILEGGRHGRLVPMRDAEALARAMTEALETPGDPAPRWARAEAFSPERIAADYLRLFGES